MSKLRKKIGLWFCREMDWHLAPISQGWDGCSFNGTCPRCGRRVLQDSGSSWFAAGGDCMPNLVEPPEDLTTAKWRSDALKRHEEAQG